MLTTGIDESQQVPAGKASNVSGCSLYDLLEANMSALPSKHRSLELSVSESSCSRSRGSGEGCGHSSKWPGTLPAKIIGDSHMIESLFSITS